MAMAAFAQALIPARNGLHARPSSGMRGAVVSTRVRAARPSPVPGRRRLNMVRAQGGDGDQKKDGGMDWDGAWSSFKRSIDEAMPDMEQYVDRPDGPPPPDYMNEAREQIKRDERVALDLWSSPAFTRLGYATLVLTFIFMVFIVGPPPPR